MLENQYRDKTTYQKMKEAEVWAIIEEDKAEKRRLSNLKQNIECDTGRNREKGRATDIIAEKVNLGSGRTYERAKPVVEKIDELQKQGNEKDAEFLKIVLNESARGAKDLAVILNDNKIIL